MTHTESRNEPLPGALAEGPPKCETCQDTGVIGDPLGPDMGQWDVVDCPACHPEDPDVVLRREGLLNDPIPLLADDAAERLMLGLELVAERDGIGFHRWNRHDAVYVIQKLPDQGEGFWYFIYPDRANPFSREQALAFIAEQKVAQS